MVFTRYVLLLRQNMKLPPSAVPDDLSADEYFELGMDYKSAGWCELARRALLKAIDCDPTGRVAAKAARFLRTKIPVNPVPEAAEAKNIQAFNQMVSGSSIAARKTFEELIADYPKYEWPFSNLAAMCIDQGDLERAQSLLAHALEINPYYVNALIHMARAHAANFDMGEAMRFVELALECDPEDEHAREVRGAIKQIADL